MDKLSALRVFKRVVEAGSFSRAAEQLEVSNATVSTAVKQLEHALGVTLIQRSTRALHPTSAGAVYLRTCNQIFALLDEAEADLLGHHGSPLGTLRVELPQGIGHDVFAPALPAFCARHPGLRVIATFADRVTDFVQEQVDVAVRGGNLGDVNLVAKPLYQGLIVLVAAPAYLERGPRIRTPGDLRDRACLGFLSEGSGRVVPWGLRSGSEHVTVEPNGPLVYNSAPSLIRAALQGGGVVMMVDLLVRPLIASHALRRVLPNWSGGPFDYHVVYPRGNDRLAKVRAFVAFARETLLNAGRNDAETVVEVAREPA